MALPNISIIAEPEESGRIVYLAMAPKTNGASQQAQLSLSLMITNNETAPVKVTKLTLTFQGSPAAAAKSYSPNLVVAAGATAPWFFQPTDSALLPQPAPPKVWVEVLCDGFDPWTIIYDLAPHMSPVTGGSFQFPARASELRIGEYWTGRGAGHASAGDGNQLFAYDMGVVGWDTTKKAWTEVFPGKKGDENDHFRIYGKPLYAMADGIVRKFLNTKDENTMLGTFTPTLDPEGNHFWIQHGDEVVVYAHLQKGSLNPALMSMGAIVKAGDFLGLAGNSGFSTNPHLHIHSIEGTVPWAGPLRPLPFRDTWVVELAALAPPDPSGPWFLCQGHGFAKTEMAIWPVATWNNWRQLGVEQIASGPAVCSWAPGRLDVFVRGTDNCLYTKSWDGKQWHNWFQLGVEQISSDPAAVSWGPNRIDVFARGTDNCLYTKSWDGNQWRNWFQLGVEKISSGPAVCSWAPGRLDVFVRGTDNCLYTKSWDGNQWQNWCQLGVEQISSDPAAVSWGRNRIDVFARGTDGTLHTKSWGGR